MSWEISADQYLQLAAEQRRPDWYRMLLGYGVRPDHGDNYHGVWQSITCHEVANAKSEDYQRRSVDTYRLLWDDYEERSFLLGIFSSGFAFMTQQHRWSSEAVWLFHQSENHLVGPELANFQDAVLRGVLLSCIWDMNHKGLEWIQGILHTPAGTRLCESLNNGNLGLLNTFFTDRRLLQPWKVGTNILSALLLLGIDIEACMIREFLQYPSGIVESRSRRPDKRVIFSKKGELEFDLDWEWIHNQSNPAHLLVSELTAFTLDSDCLLNFVDESIDIPNKELYGTGPLYYNRYDTAKCYSSSGGEKWPPRFARRAAKKERKERARLGQKQARSRMPGAWVP
jgi:hypothetical protein